MSDHEEPQGYEGKVAVAVAVVVVVVGRHGLHAGGHDEPAKVRVARHLSVEGRASALRAFEDGFDLGGGQTGVREHAPRISLVRLEQERVVRETEVEVGEARCGGGRHKEPSLDRGRFGGDDMPACVDCQRASPPRSRDARRHTPRP
jgi:hypothetical protein